MAFSRAMNANFIPAPWRRRPSPESALSDPWQALFRRVPLTQRARRSYPPRPRRACLGELVQLDGSEHAWFEDHGPVCTLSAPCSCTSTMPRASSWSCTSSIRVLGVSVCVPYQGPIRAHRTARRWPGSPRHSWCAMGTDGVADATEEPFKQRVTGSIPVRLSRMWRQLRDLPPASPYRLRFHAWLRADPDGNDGHPRRLSSLLLRREGDAPDDPPQPAPQDDDTPEAVIIEACARTRSWRVAASRSETGSAQRSVATAVARGRDDLRPSVVRTSRGGAAGTARKALGPAPWLSTSRAPPPARRPVANGATTPTRTTKQSLTARPCSRVSR